MTVNRQVKARVLMTISGNDAPVVLAHFSALGARCVAGFTIYESLLLKTVMLD